MLPSDESIMRRCRLVAPTAVGTLLLLLLGAAAPAESGDGQRSKDKNAEHEPPPPYGVDISYPMHHSRVSTNYPWLPHNMDPSLPVPDEFLDMPLQPLGDVQSRYEHFIQGCVDYYNQHTQPKGERCYAGEQQRIAMTRSQPQSMYNYTKIGYTKIRAPEHVFSLIKRFWDVNRGKEKVEQWHPGNIYVNHWESPSYLLSVENEEFEGGGSALKQHIWNAARDTIEAWTGHKQAECSLYGIRIYKENAMLAPHVDRMPLVSSAIINVDSDVDEPWPLAVIGHDGIERNVTMEPGDLVLYESHSVIHGRQFPLKGRFMANVFIHFEPIGPIGGQVQLTGDLPPYLIPGSPAEKPWREGHPRGHSVKGKHGSFATGSTELHHHAQAGDVEKMEAALATHADLVNVRDKNGWQALHEAVRTGKLEIVRMLLDKGAEVNARTGATSKGFTALEIAKKHHGDTHEIVELLEARGAKERQTEL